VLGAQRVFEGMDRMVALQRGLTTWANWVDANFDIKKSKR
jgi:hypothetical protein